MGIALALQDFFAIGLGLDLAGGYLVARGLLTSDADMATARTFAGWGAQMTVMRARDRIDATFGLLYLGFGFLLQIVGYAAQLARPHTVRPSRGAAVGFLLLTAAALALALLAHSRAAPGRVRALALRVTLLDGNALPRELPAARELLDLGVELGDDAREGESYGAYARRVWGIESVSDPDEIPDETARRQRQSGRSPIRPVRRRRSGGWR